ncbi:ATPase [Enterococcus sp. BWB1-3]|nr:ATPase [Enterococcus sp. BWB1-3]
MRLWLYLFKDIELARSNKKKGIVNFKEFGLTLFCGRQGSGKTMSLCYYALYIMKKYPTVKVLSNFGFNYQHEEIFSIYDIVEASEKAEAEGYDGTLILWDELQNDFDSYSKVSTEVLAFITQQRKRCVKILATSQVFTRVSKPLREQTFEVVECRTFFGRWTRARFYDAINYIENMDKTTDRKNLQKGKLLSFIQEDALRGSYDSYAVIQRLIDKSKQEKEKEPSDRIIVINE